MRLIIVPFLFVALGFAAQPDNGKGNPHSRTNPPAVVTPANPNGPGNSPTAVDRDKGRDRAEDVGKGKKKGLYKPRKHKKLK